MYWSVKKLLDWVANIVDLDQMPKNGQAWANIADLDQMPKNGQAWANSVDKDQMLYSVASDLGLHCLLRPIHPNTLYIVLFLIDELRFNRVATHF